FFLQAEDGIRDATVTGVQTCALPIFHARFRRTNPLPFKEDYVILDGVHGRGHYVGTYVAWGVNNAGWWGEGEIKFFMDGDGRFRSEERRVGKGWGSRR